MNLDLDQQIRRWAEQRPCLRHSAGETRRVISALRSPLRLVEPAAAHGPALAWRLCLAGAAAAALLAVVLWPAWKRPPQASAQITVALAVPCGQPRAVLPQNADVVLVKLNRYPGLFDQPPERREVL